MNINPKSLILDEAIRIGDELLAKAETTCEGMCWTSVDQNGDHICYHKSETIYDGVCGIVLFMAELYQQTRQEKYLHAAVEGLRWVEWYCKHYPAARCAFLTGRMSVPYTYLQLYKHTKNTAFLDKALDITKECAAALETNLAEYINGTAGTLLCLLHLHAVTRAEWLLTYIDQCAATLIRNVHIGKKGIFWDRLPDNIHGLCGFSHGAAGIGYVLLELGHYFSNPSFYWLAEQAFAYEAQYYNSTSNNWADLRKLVRDKQDEIALEEAYDSRDYNFFTNGLSINAWCHGAAGIGLSRLRAFELLQKSMYEIEAKRAIEHTMAEGLQTFTLCHGKGGNAELFLKAYELYDDDAYLQMAAAVANEALHAKELNGQYFSGTKYPGEDTSLFLGNAGIGYFYLRLLNPRQVTSVLMPVVEACTSTDLSPYDTLCLSVSAIQYRLVTKVFPRTLRLLENVCPRKTDKHHRKPATSQAISWTDDFLQFTECQISKLPSLVSSLVQDVMRLEQIKLRMNQDVISDVLMSLKINFKRRRAAVLDALADPALSGIILALDPDLQLISTKFNPDTPGETLTNNSLKACEHAFLLAPSLPYTTEHQLSKFTAIVISAFCEAKTVSSAMPGILLHFADLPEIQKAEVQRMIMAQIRQCIYAGFLLEPDRHMNVIQQAVFAGPGAD